MLAIAAKYEKEIHKSIWLWGQKGVWIGGKTGHWATENGGQARGGGVASDFSFNLQHFLLHVPKITSASLVVVVATCNLIWIRLCQIAGNISI